MHALIFAALSVVAADSREYEEVTIFGRTVSRTVVRIRAPVIAARAAVVHAPVVAVRAAVVHAPVVAVRQRAVVVQAAIHAPFVPSFAFHAPVYSAPAVFAAPAYASAYAPCVPAAPQAYSAPAQPDGLASVAAELRALREEFGVLSKAMRGLK